MLRGMKTLAFLRVPIFFLILGLACLGSLPAQTAPLDLTSLAKKTRPAVLLLVVTDSGGKEISMGTGFLVSPDGKLITNYHVIKDGAGVTAKAENGAFYVVEGVLAADAENDLAVLKLRGKDFPALTLGD